MAAPQVNFAIGLVACALLGIPVLLWRPRWLVWLPLAMPLCGAAALAVGPLKSIPPGALHGLAFQAAALAWLALLGGYAAWIRWGMRRLSEAEEALARLRRETAPYRPAARLLAVLPLAATGLATAALLWPRRPEHHGGPPEAAQWARLVARRLGFDPGESLGIVHPTWEPQGAWLCGDLGAYAPPDPAELLARARANGCDFLTLLAPEGAPLPPLPPHPGLAVLRGVIREEGDRLLFLEQGDATLSLPRDDGAEGWDELYALYRAGGPFIGILGLAGAERLSAREARSRWCPRVGLLGGVWDRFLARGFRLSGAAAASGFQDPAKHFWPGEFARSYVWSRGRAPGDVLDGLRRGCAWAVEGGIVRELDFGVGSPGLGRPARMGEAARIAPGDEAMVELALDVPPADFAGRPNALDEVELISNFGGEPAVIARFRNIREAARLTHRLPPAEDRNGGVGFYVRARGWRQLDGGARLWFQTNAIRMLVRAGQAPPPGPATSPVRVAARHRPPEPPPKPATAQPAPAPTDDVAARLAALGLPRGARVVHTESFQKPPAQDWHGEHASIIGDRGPAMGDEEMRVELLRRMDLAADARLFFLCYAVECTRLTIIARLGERAAPHLFVRELPERQWVPLDLSLAEDFLAARGAEPPGPQGRILVQAIEWRGARLGPLSRFYIADLVVYEPTASSRQALAWQRAVGLDGELREASGRSAPPSSRPRAEAAAKRLAALIGQLNPEQGPVAAGELEAAERALAELAEACQRLRLQAAMPRAFGVADPAFAATFAPPGQRIARQVSPAGGASLPRVPLTATWELAAAGAEAESVQIAVMGLWEKLEGVDIRVSDFLPVGGARAEAARPQVTLELVDAVEVRPRPGVPREQAGLVPDPLRPFQPFDVEPGEARCALLTVEAPPDLLPGEYEAAVKIEPRGLAPLRAAVKLRRWGFALEGQPLPVFAPLDESAVAAGLGLGKSLPHEARRALYELLLRHRISPIPLLGGSEEADLAEALYCLERGAELVVLREAASAAPGARDPEVLRAARQAGRLAEAGWPRRGALLLPLAPPAEPERAKMAAFARTLAQERPGLLLLAGGEGEPPGGLIAHLWRRPLGQAFPKRPRDDEAEVRLSRTARREAWELLPASPEAAAPSLLLTSPLLHARLIPWLAWQHGVRAIFLRGVARWSDPDDLRDAVLLYPPAKDPHAAQPPAGSQPAGGSAQCSGSLRLAALRDGIEDYALLRLLWDRARQLRERAQGRDAPAATPLADAERLLAEAAVAAGSFERPCRDPLVLSALRTRIARELERLETAWWAEVDAADDLPPPPPELAAKPAEGHVVLSWTRSPDPKAAAYNIYRSRDPAIGFVRLNPAPVAGLSYVDRTAEGEATYHYFVRACRDAAVEGPRSQTVAVRTQAAPRVVWLPGPPPGAPGPWRVALRLEGPGAGGLLPLVRPQIAWEVVGGAAAPRAFQEMARQPDATWSFDIPDPGWGQLAGKSIRLRVRIVDRQNRVAAQDVERRETIEPRPAVRNP